MRVAVVAEWYPSRAGSGAGHLGAPAGDGRARRRRRGAGAGAAAPDPSARSGTRFVHIPPAIGALGGWIAGARTSLRPTSLDGLSVTPVPFLAPPRPISYGSWGYWMAPPLARALDRLHAEWPFDVLHAHCLAPAGHAAARWVRRRGRVGPAFVVSAHGPDMINVPENSSVGRRACVAAMAVADLVVANSTWAARRCEAIAGRRLPVRVVHLGADVPPAAHTPNGAVRMVTVAHLVARKRHETVLRALSMLDPARRPEYLVIGDGPRREPLERLAVELGVADRVRFLGSARQSRRGGAGRGVRRVRDAGRRGAVRGGVRRGDGRRVAGDRQSWRGGTGGHRRCRRRDAARRARRRRAGSRR